MSDRLTFKHSGRQVVMPDVGGTLTEHHRRGVFYEAKMLRAIAKVGRTGVYVDVGANIGNHAAHLEMFCPSTKVIAYEPLDFVFEHLMETRRANGLSFEAHLAGLADRSGVVETRIGRRTYTIATRVLDDEELVDVAVVKLDIEGMEPDALRGMTDTLDRCSPHLYIEAHSDEELDAQAEVISPIGYQRTGRLWNATPTYEWTRHGAPAGRASRRWSVRRRRSD